MKNKYTKVQDLFLIDNVKGITLEELTDKFNKQFDLNLSKSAIANRKHTLNISSGITGGQFEKGHVSWNKGTKGLTHANKNFI